jgi:hypothetical protein
MTRGLASPVEPNAVPAIPGPRSRPTLPMWGLQRSVYEHLISTLDWYEFANFARWDKIFGDVFATYHEFCAHDSEQAFPIWVEHARPGIPRAGNISNQGAKFGSEPKWQNLRRDDVRPGRACLIHNDDRIFCRRRHQPRRPPIFA